MINILNHPRFYSYSPVSSSTALRRRIKKKQKHLFIAELAIIETKGAEQIECSLEYPRHFDGFKAA
jgi:hypothetical protein